MGQGILRSIHPSLVISVRSEFALSNKEGRNEHMLLIIVRGAKNVSKNPIYPNNVFFKKDVCVTFLVIFISDYFLRYDIVKYIFR